MKSLKRQLFSCYNIVQRPTYCTTPCEFAINYTVNEKNYANQFRCFVSIETHMAFCIRTYLDRIYWVSAETKYRFDYELAMHLHSTLSALNAPDINKCTYTQSERCREKNGKLYKELFSFTLNLKNELIFIIAMASTKYLYISMESLWMMNWLE